MQLYDVFEIVACMLIYDLFLMKLSALMDK